MEQNINIAELLKDCPKGMELYSPIFGNVKLEKVFNNFIYVFDSDELIATFDKKGKYKGIENGECQLLPSKDQRDWSKFQRPFKDGDIVTWEDRGSLIAFIYKERKDVATVKHHFALYTGNLGTVTNGEISLVESEIVFATEEEKQKLFDAIKANGYNWNAETKTLEKVINRNKFTIGAIVTNGKIKGKICSRDVDSYKLEDGTYIFFNEVHNWRLVSNKFDITTLKPFDKVLVRNTNKDYWEISMFGHISNHDKQYFMCIANSGFYQCVPYNDKTKHLLDTTNNCDEFYKNWE